MGEAARKPGRPTKMTEEVIKRIEEAKSLGFDDRSCAERGGIHVDTYYSWKRDNPAFSERINAAKATGQTFVAGQLFKAIQKGNIASIIFWLKTRTREFRENKDLDTLAREEAVRMIEDLCPELPANVAAQIQAALSEKRPRRIKMVVQ